MTAFDARDPDARPACTNKAALPVMVALFLLAAVPVLVCEIAPLGDMPNHLARAWLIDRLPDDPGLQAFYRTEWRLFGFQSTDVLLPSLIAACGLSLGQKLYILLALGLLMAGTAALHRALFGRVGLWPAAAVLFLYNLPLAVGQVSFLLACGLALLLFAAWIATAPLARTPRAAILRTAAFALGAFGLMLCHAFVLGIYGLLVVSQAVAELRDARRAAEIVRLLIPAAVQFVLPVLCFLLTFQDAVHGPTLYGEPLSKAIALFAGLITYATLSDIGVILGIGIGLWLVERKLGLRLAPGMKVPVAVLLVAALLMPHLLSGVLGADIRLPTFLPFLLLGCSTLRRGGKGESAALILGIAALLGLRIVTLTPLWLDFDADYRAFRAADAAIAPGSRVMVIPRRDALAGWSQPTTPFPFVAAFAVIDRGVFLPHLYTMATPLRFGPAGEAMESDVPAQARTISWQPKSAAFAGADAATIAAVNAAGQRVADKDLVSSRIDWSDWPERFDYAVDMDYGAPRNPVPALLTPVGSGRFFTLYRIHPPGQ
jgi:hypothetical protein